MIDPEKWYSVDAVARHWNCGRDKVIRLVKAGALSAMVMSVRSSVRKRIYEVRRILGAEVLRFEREHTR